MLSLVINPFNEKIYFEWLNKLQLIKWYQNGLNMYTFGGYDFSSIQIVLSKELRWNYFYLINMPNNGKRVGVSENLFTSEMIKIT